MRHVSDDWRWLPLVTTADDLDGATLEPVKEDLQRGAGYHEFLVPDVYPGNEILPHPFGRPFCLATPAEDAVIGLGLDAPSPHFFRQSIGRRRRDSSGGRAGSLAWSCRNPRRH